MLLVANSFVINPALKPRSYDVTTSFDPVCYLASTPMVLVVQGTSPYKTLNDLIAAARAKPGALSLGAAQASSLQVAFEVIKRSAGINMTFVPFPGTAPAINTLMGGHVTAVFADYPTVVGHLEIRNAARPRHRLGQAQSGPAGRADLRRGRRDRL